MSLEQKKREKKKRGGRGGGRRGRGGGEGRGGGGGGGGGGGQRGSHLSLKPRTTFWMRMTLSVMALSLSISSNMSWWS